MTTFESERATQGELISFLDVVEKDARDIAASIARRSARHGPGPFGEAYYLGTYTPNLVPESCLLSSLHFVTGSSVSPPIMPHQYVDEYVTSTSAYVPDSQMVEQIKPRKIRDIAYGSWPGTT